MDMRRLTTEQLSELVLKMTYPPSKGWEHTGRYDMGGLTVDFHISRNGHSILGKRMDSPFVSRSDMELAVRLYDTFSGMQMEMTHQVILIYGHLLMPPDVSHPGISVASVSGSGNNYCQDIWDIARN